MEKQATWDREFKCKNKRQFLCFTHAIPRPRWEKPWGCLKPLKRPLLRLCTLTRAKSPLQWLGESTGYLTAEHESWLWRLSTIDPQCFVFWGPGFPGSTVGPVRTRKVSLSVTSHHNLMRNLMRKLSMTASSFCNSNFKVQYMVNQLCLKTT